MECGCSSNDSGADAVRSAVPAPGSAGVERTASTPSATHSPHENQIVPFPRRHVAGQTATRARSSKMASVLSATLLLALASVAQADPPTVAQLQPQVDALPNTTTQQKLMRAMLEWALSESTRETNAVYSNPEIYASPRRHLRGQPRPGRPGPAQRCERHPPPGRQQHPHADRFPPRCQPHGHLPAHPALHEHRPHEPGRRAESSDANRTTRSPSDVDHDAIDQSANKQPLKSVSARRTNRTSR